MEEKRITSFKEFWPYYMSQHRDPKTRALHYVGTAGALTLLGAGIVQAKPSLFIAALFVGYGLAWIGHFFVEKNKPATFQYPFYSFAADYVMLFRFLTGRLDRETKKL